MSKRLGTALIAAGLFLAFGSAIATSLHVQSAQPGASAFQNVTVIPMDRERTLEGQTVVVRGRRIVAIGPTDAVQIPQGARRIDGTGSYLMPGLAEMHGHLPSGSAGMAEMDRVLFLFVANGITTVRGMLGDTIQVTVREQVARGARLGPQLFVSSPSINGNSVPDVETAWRVVTQHRAAGYDLLKIHPGLTREAFDAVVATAQREGIPFAGHIPADVGLERALISGIGSVEHIDGYLRALLAPDAPLTESDAAFFGFNLIDHVDASRIPEIAAATRAAGAWVTPTQVLFENRLLGDPAQTAQRPEMRFVPRPTLDRWVEIARNNQRQLQTDEGQIERFIELRRRLIRALHDAGAGLLLGADAPQVFNLPGFATIQEVEALVEAGLTPFQALETGTRNPAIYLGLEDSFGTVEVGKRADLVLLEANPLTDISNVRRLAGVMVAGRWLPAEEINRRLSSYEVGTN